MPFWSKKRPVTASLAQRIRDLAAVDQRSGINFHQVKDDSTEVGAELLDLDEAAYADVLRDLLKRPGGLFRAYHLPAAVFGTPRARATLRTPEDVALVAGILLQAYGSRGTGIRTTPWTFLMDPLKSLLVSGVEAVHGRDTKLDQAMSALTEVLALEHPQLSGLTGRCTFQLRRLSHSRFNALLRRWAGARHCLGKQLEILQTGLGEGNEAFEDCLLVLLDAPQPEPTKDWQARWAAARPSADGVQTRELLTRIVEIGISEPGVAEGEPVSLTRGAIWALADWKDRPTRDVLESVVLADLPREVPANAALWSLASPGDEESIARLLKVSRKVRHRGLKTRAEQLIRRTATARHETPESLADQLVPEHGVDASGARTWELDGFHVVVRLTAEGDVERVITGPNGKSTASLPKALHNEHIELWHEVATTTKQLKTTLTAQKHRLEDAMVDGRSWSMSRWHETIEGNPIMASLATRLVWKATSETAVAFGMPSNGRDWHACDGRVIAIPDDAAISLPHLLAMPDVEVNAWQHRIVTQGVVQPFRQLFREIYIVTPVERQAGDHSSRFAGFSVPLAQVYALTKTRAWKGKLGLAGFHGAGEGWKEFPNKNLRVGLRHAGDDPQLALGVIEEVFFERREAARSRTKVWRRIALDEVDPVVFSEAMRDVDLIVSVASLGRQFTSTEWEALNAKERDAWQAAQPRAEYITEVSGQARGKLLLEVASLLGVESRVRVDGHFAVVEGKLARYRVHLGTSTIYMEPGRHALCIVPAKHEARRLLLPFEEGDYMTSLIFSKVLMMLDDDRITDPTILRQMGRSA